MRISARTLAIPAALLLSTVVSSGERLAAELSRDRFQQRKVQTGEASHVRLRRLQVFAQGEVPTALEDYSI